MANTGISLQEGHGIAGELRRRADLYTKLEEVIRVAMQAESDKKRSAWRRAER